MPQRCERRLFFTLLSSLVLYLTMGYQSAEASTTDPGAAGSAPVAAAPYMVQLEGLPATRLYAAGRAAGESADRLATLNRQHMARLMAQQDAVLELLIRQGREPTVLSRLSRVYNGMGLLLTPREVSALRRSPEVVAVHPILPKQRTNSSSVPFLGVPGVWQQTALTGAGVRVGIIDSGIDYLHRDFAGSGLAADYASNDPTIIGEGFFPSAKVVGGWDFVGDAYDASSSDPAAQMPQPDPDPMDCNGHGTHVAGTAAGFGVLGDGSTYLGAYDDTTPFDDLAIGPGVAPRALLYALRVFGCGGETAVVEAALEWAVDPDGDGDFSDRLDVVNLSLTSALASAQDPTAVAADNATLAGVVVVASAGNDGGTHFAIGSPAVASGVIAVAASWDPDPVFPARAVRIESPPDLAAAHQAGGANFGPPLVDPGITGEAVRAEPLDACAPLTNPAPAIDGKVVLVERSDSCTYVTQVRNAQNAGVSGASAVVIVNDRPGLEGVFNDGTGGDITIPPLMVRQLAGQKILQALPGNVVLTLTPTVLEDMFAIFSSRGPRLGDLLAKPDVAAPGVAITSARLGDAVSGGLGAMILSGTSMASPHVAGTAALLRDLHRDWTPAQIKARLINTSRDVFFDPEQTPPRVGPPQMGAGRIDPAAAMLGEASLRQAADGAAVTLTFGDIEVSAEAWAERWVRLQNGPQSEVTYDLSVDVLSPVPGVEVSPGVAAVSLQPLQSMDFPLQVHLVGAALRHNHDPSLEEATVGFERHWISEWAGYLVATPQDGDDVPLRLPIYLAPRAIASMSVVENPLELGDGTVGSRQLSLVGQSLDQGPATPVDEVSLVSPYELTASQSEAEGSPFPGVAELGIVSDVAQRDDGLASATLAFGLVAHSANDAPFAWSTPHEVAVSILIDNDEDGLADFEISNSDIGSVSFNFLTDAHVSVVTDLESGDRMIGQNLGFLAPQDRHTVPFTSDVMALAVAASSLGLSELDSRFDYAVEVRPRRAGGSLASTAPQLSGAPQLARTPQLSRAESLGAAVPMPELRRSYDAAAPGLRFPHASQQLIFPDQDGTAVTVDYDLPALAANGGLGLLLLHHHNGHGQRGEVVTLRGDTADLVLTAEAVPVAAAGRRWQAQWWVRNRGRQPAAEVRLRVGLPEGLELELETTDGTCQPVAGPPATVDCDVGALAAGEARRVSLGTRVRADVPAGARLSVLGRLSTSSLDAAPLNDHHAVELLISQLVPSLQKSIIAGDLLPGGSVRYRLRLRNGGPSPILDLAGPEIVDRLPASLELALLSTTVGMVEFDDATGEVRWQGALGVGSEVDIDITATVGTGLGDHAVSNQAVSVFDSDGDGEADAMVVSDNPDTATLGDPTVFVIGGLFADGFESGTTGAWFP